MEAEQEQKAGMGITEKLTVKVGFYNTYF